jgi:hypothetical protein
MRKSFLKIAASIALGITAVQSSHAAANITFNDLTETLSVDHSGFAQNNNAYSEIVSSDVSNGEAARFQGTFVVPGVADSPIGTQLIILTEGGTQTPMISDFLLYSITPFQTPANVQPVFSARQVKGIFASVDLPPDQARDAIIALAGQLDISLRGIEPISMPETGLDQIFGIEGSGLTMHIQSDVEATPDGGATLGLATMGLLALGGLRVTSRK